MEIAPAPPRRPLSSRARILLVLGVFAPVTLLALVPTMLGLQRYVVTDDSMSGAVDRGSVVFELLERTAHDLQTWSLRGGHVQVRVGVL